MLNKLFLDIFKDDILWLKHRCEPLEEVLHKWNNTYELRRSSTTTTVDAFYKEWPILKNSKIDILVSKI